MERVQDLMTSCRPETLSPYCLYKLIYIVRSPSLAVSVELAHARPNRIIYTTTKLLSYDVRVRASATLTGSLARRATLTHPPLSLQYMYSAVDIYPLIWRLQLSALVFYPEDKSYRVID